MTQSAYKPTSLSEIVPAWNEFFSAANIDEGIWSRTANGNGIVIAGSGVSLDRIDSFLDAIVLLHPSRFVVVQEDRASRVISAAVSARCQGVSATEHVCAEIVRLGVPSEQFPALPSVLRSLLLTGMSTDLYLVGGEVPSDLLSIGLSLSDTAIMDGGEHASFLGTVSSVVYSPASVVDLQWLRLSSWRDALKELFTRPAFLPFLGALNRVSVEYSHGRWAAGALFVGWLMRMLRLDVRSFGVRGYEALSSGHRSVILNIIEAPPPSAASITKLELLGEGWSLVIARGGEGLLECSVKVGKDTVFKSTRPCEDEAAAAVLQRYFAVGESVKNYRVSLQGAVELERLQRSFAKGA